MVRIRLAGVCRTDLELARGYMGFSGVPGHEFVGVVAEHEDSGLVGRRVVGEINMPCGQCSYCRSGLGNHCPTRRVLGIAGAPGVFAEYAVLPAENLHLVPDEVPDNAAVFTEPLAAAFEIVEQVDVSGKRVAVLGDGKLGLLSARALKSAGPASLVMIGKHREKMERLGADGIRTALPSEFAAVSPFEKFDVVVEATGRLEGFGAALDLVMPRGVIVAKSTVAGVVPVDLSRVVVDEITVVGSRCGPFRKALAAIASGSARVTDLIDSVFPLERAAEAMEAAAAPGALKVLIEVGG